MDIIKEERIKHLKAARDKLDKDEPMYEFFNDIVGYEEGRRSYINGYKTKRGDDQLIIFGPHEWKKEIKEDGTVIVTDLGKYNGWLDKPDIMEFVCNEKTGFTFVEAKEETY